MTKTSSEEIKVGDIVYWYSKSEKMREIMYRTYPFLKDGYGVVQSAESVGPTVSFPSVGETLGLFKNFCHKVVME